MGEPLMRSSSTCSTTLQISSTRSHSCLRAGLAPKQNLKVRRMSCWLRQRWRASDSLDVVFVVFLNFPTTSVIRGGTFTRQLPKSAVVAEDSLQLSFSK